MNTFSLLSKIAALLMYDGGHSTSMVWFAGTDIPPFFHVTVAAFSLRIGK